MAPTTSVLLLSLLPTTLLASLTPSLLRRDTLTFSSDLTKRCVGDCATCFGSTYQPCPNSDYYCYSPGDATYGIESCTSDGSSSSPPDTSSPSSPSGNTGYNWTYTDWCNDGDCKSCFGASYVPCPGDSINCYDPANATTTCPDFASGGAAAAGDLSSSSSSYGYDISVSSSTTTLSSLDTSIATTPPSLQTTATTALGEVGGGGASAAASSASDSDAAAFPSSSSSFTFSNSGSRTTSAADGAAATSASSSPASQTVNAAGGAQEGVLGGVVVGAVGVGVGALGWLI